MKVVLEKWLEKRTAEIKLECERRERLEDVFFKYLNDVHRLTFPPEEYIYIVIYYYYCILVEKIMNQLFHQIVHLKK